MRVPNRCWITQTDDLDTVHREDRVLARRDGEQRGDYGETYCKRKLLPDRKRMNDVPTTAKRVCARCRQGNRDEFMRGVCL